MRRVLEERFRSRVDKGDSTISCWIWNGAVQSRGYGVAYFNGVDVLAHRLAYELTKGKIPDNLTIGFKP
jgi:hypothetical protein